MRLCLACLCLTLSLACTNKQQREPDREREAVDSPTNPPMPPAANPHAFARLSEAPRDRVLVLAHEPSADAASVRAIAIDQPSPSVGPALPVPTLAFENWSGHFRVAAAHGGGGSFVVAREQTLQLRSLSDRATVEIALEGPPAALHMVGARVFVGLGNQVLLADFEPSPPTLRTMHQRPEMRFKAYDLFARDGGWLIAIDDIVTPFYADSFELLDDEVHHRAGFELPSAINGHYQFALLHAHGPGLGTLYSIMPYGIMSGSGHDLVALPLRDAVPAVDTDNLVVNRGGKLGIPVLEEHVPRGRGEPQLLAGEHHTPWTGLARVDVGGSGRLLISAGERGLFMLPEDFDAASKPTVIELGGACLDVLAVGSRVFVLRGSLDQSELLELSLADPATPITTLALAGPYRSFVR